MPAGNFVHLHVHTDYSLLDGACEITKLMDRAAELGMPAATIYAGQREQELSR